MQESSEKDLTKKKGGEKSIEKRGESQGTPVWEPQFCP